MTHPSNTAPASEPSRTRQREQQNTDETTRGSTSVGLLTAEWHVSRVDDATLVTVHVTNTHTATRDVRIENRLDGPVLPPCQHGVAEEGWDSDGVTRRVPGEETVSVGYACHAPPQTPPVEVQDGPADGETGATPIDRALRSLGDHAPPRAVVWSEPPDHLESSASATTATPPESMAEEECSGDSCDTTDYVTDPADTDSPTVEADDWSEHEACEAEGVTHTPPAEAVPTTIESWFCAVEARLTTADRLAGDVDEATPVLASLGGRAGVEVLEATLEADAVALERVASRASELAAEVDAAAVPDLREER